MKLTVSAKMLLMTLLFTPLMSSAQLSGSHDQRGSISGRILLAGGNNPAQQVNVAVRRLGDGWMANTLTDASGEFAFKGLPSGSYSVVVDEPGCELIKETVELDSAAPHLVLFLNRTTLVRPDAVGYVVSARELSIPPKVHKLFQEGLKRLAKKDPAGSLPYFQRAVTKLPSYYEAYLQIGVAYILLGQAADAEKAIRKAIEISGDGCADADFALGGLLNNRSEFADAEKITRRGLALAPASWQGHFELARALLGMNQVEEAEQSAEKARSLQPDFPTVHLLLANMHLRQQRYTALVKDLDDYLRLDPSSPMAATVRADRDKVQRALSAAESTPVAQSKP